MTFFSGGVLDSLAHMLIEVFSHFLRLREKYTCKMDFFVKYIKIFVIFCGIFGYNYALRKPSRFLFDFFSAYFQILCAISQILVYTDLCLLALDQGD